MTDGPLRSDLLSPGPEDDDWSDVLKRARRARHRRQIYGAALLVALAAIVVACSSALGHPIVDFGRAHKAPESVVVNFGSLDQPVPQNQGPPADLGPGVIADQTREIPGLYLNGRPYRLYVAPTTSGGVCASEGDSMPGMCYTRDFVVGRLYSWRIEDREIGGAFGNSRGRRLEVSYADGSKKEVPFVWVTEPINAGFFVLGIPKAHRSYATRPTALTLYDARGEVLARHERIGGPWFLGKRGAIVVRSGLNSTNPPDDRHRIGTFPRTFP